MIKTTKTKNGNYTFSFGGSVFSLYKEKQWIAESGKYKFSHTTKKGVLERVENEYAPIPFVSQQVDVSEKDYKKALKKQFGSKVHILKSKYTNYIKKGLGMRDSQSYFRGMAHFEKDEDISKQFTYLSKWCMVNNK